jgi:hypothetical protein
VIRAEAAEHWSNVSFRESNGAPPNSKVLVPIARIIGVTVEELLGESKPKR